MNNRTAPLVLCIDDDRETLNLLEYLLKSGKYEVITACNGMQGLELVGSSLPEVILLDVEMPGMNGYEVCRQLQRDPVTSYIPVVFLTAHNGEQDRKKAFAAGAADFLAKPFHLNPLLGKIRIQLERNVRWRELKKTQQNSAAPLARFHDFQKTVARKLGFSPERNARWRQIAAVQLYEKAFDFGLTHTDLAQLIAGFMTAPYIPHITSQIIRIGVMPTAFSKANHIIAVDAAGCGLNFILSNPFNPATHSAMTTCRGSEHGMSFGVTEPAVIARLFERSARDRAEESGPQRFPAFEMPRRSTPPQKPLESQPPARGPAVRSVTPSEPADRAQPAAPPQPPVLGNQPPDVLHIPCEGPNGPPSILVVDDDETEQLLVRHFLASAGYQVTIAADGIDALLMLGKRHFDLILSDVVMPNLDGIRLLELIRQKAIRTPVIMVTGSTGPEDEVRGLELGAADYVRKPISGQALLFRVRKALGEHHSHLGAA